MLSSDDIEQYLQTFQEKTTKWQTKAEETLVSIREATEHFNKLFNMGDTNETAGVSVKIPDYMPRRPDIWLIQVEAQFDIAHVVVDKTKYHHLLCRLPANILEKIADFIITPFADGHYNKLKEILLERFAPSTSDRVMHVLYKAQCKPDTKPSDLFRQMIADGGKDLAYELIVKRFNELLPENIRSTCTLITNDILRKYKADQTRNIEEEQKLLDAADILAAAQAPSVSTIKHQNNFNRQPNRGFNSSSRGRGSNFRGRGYFSRGRGRGGYNNFNQRGRAPSPHRNNNPNGQYCRIHVKYGENANFCADPHNCRFPRANAIQENAEN